MKNEAGGGGSLQGNELKLDDQCLSSLPGWVVETPRHAAVLKILYLNKNQFTRLPALLGLPHLEKLNMAGNSLSVIHAGVLPPSLLVLELINNHTVSEYDDLHLARYIEPVAHCNSVEIDVIDCPFVAVCCDGVWDVLSDQQAVDAVLATAPEYERGAAALRDLAFLHGSTDNVGCRHCHVAQTPPLKLTPRTYLSR